MRRLVASWSVEDLEDIMRRPGAKFRVGDRVIFIGPEERRRADGFPCPRVGDAGTARRWEPWRQGEEDTLEIAWDRGFASIEVVSELNWAPIVESLARLA